MPRKEWVPKNQFCKRSKFDDDEFATIVRYYFHEILYGDSRNSYCFYFERWHLKNKVLNRKVIDPPDVNMHLFEDTLFPSFENVDGLGLFYPKIKEKTLKEGKNKLLTRQKISNYFNKISQYLWDNYFSGIHSDMVGEGFFDCLIDLIYGNIEEITGKYKNMYDAISIKAICLTDGDIKTSLLFYLLSNRSKVTRGFKRDKFYLEFSRALYVCLIVRISKINLDSIYSVKNDLILNKILVDSTQMILTMFKNKPL